MRMDAYRAAWAKCLSRVQVSSRPPALVLLTKGTQSIIHEMHAHFVDDIVNSIHDAYVDVLPGLPYPEIPVISITGELSLECRDRTESE